MKPSTQNIFWSIVFFMVPTIAISHPGHLTETQAHEFIHAEHLLILISLMVIAAIVSRIFKKFF